MDRPSSLALVLVCACAFAPSSCKQMPAPLGEALIVVDTDSPVPALAGRLRIDFYTDTGEWYESRDVAAPDPANWPVSFSVFTPDEQGARAVVLRLRVYPESKTRDYLGERFRPRGADAPVPVDKRLRVSGSDLTPRTEPQPLVAIDRLVRVALEPGVVGSARITLRGACFGTMADLATGASCVDTENARTSLATMDLDPNMTLPRESVQGAFGRAQACGSAARSEEVCVPGGAFVLGNGAAYGTGELSGVPERVALIDPFYADRYEYTVARWRAAYTADPTAFGVALILNDGPLGKGDDAATTVDPRVCSASRLPLGREDLALTCVTWELARSLCLRDGGDLPTEAQWEYAALRAGRASKATFPWGEAPPSCERAVFGRFAQVASRLTGDCVAYGRGPLEVSAAETPDGDISALGLVGFGGGVGELARDAFDAYDAPCWSRAGLREPSCPPEAGTRRVARGGSWASNAASLSPSARQVANTPTSYSPSWGFRCVRSAVGGAP